MTTQTNTDIKLENFNDVWSLGYHEVIEKKFHELLGQAEALQDKSIYLQILSQIALAQALQKKFDAAHKTLDDAQALLTPAYDLARARILLERGRVFHQADNIQEAKVYFEQAFEFSAQHKFDFYTIDAAHMIAILAEPTQEKIQWNQRALDLAAHTKDSRAALWIGSLSNNLGQNYFEEKQFEKALSAFQKALECRKKEGYAPNIRIAQWAIARTLRLLERLDNAEIMLLTLVKEYDALTESGNLDMPVESLKLARGWVHEELAEVYHVKSKFFANAAYNDLSPDEMFRKTAPERLERLKQLGH
ncbi:MAG: tetratricopeptide repeat protein [Candidatus Dependentiae bacterium]|nr:tetratricopeptide repeat protein [Candidatus Dependentiae bacterium]